MTVKSAPESSKRGMLCYFTHEQFHVAVTELSLWFL